MKRICLLSLIWIFFFFACEKMSSPPQGKSENAPIPKVIVEKEKIEKEQPFPPEVKIKLKKDGKDSYSWELTGSDVDQLLKVNGKLRKQLEGEKSK